MTSTIKHTTTTADARTVRMADALSVPDGGFTVNPRTGADVTDGFAVSIYPHAERIIGGTVTPDDIRSFVFDNRELLSVHGNVVGGWRNPDDGLAYLDVSTVVALREWAENLARENDQLAYFDFAAGQSVEV